MRLWFAVFGALISLLLALGPVRAEGVSFSASNFNPAVNPHHYYVTEGGKTIPHLTPTAALLLHYAHQPVRLVDPADDSFDHGLVSYRLSADVLVGFGLFDRLELGVGLPVTLVQDSDGLQALGRPDGNLAAGIGDLRLVPKVRLLTHRGITLALAAPIHIPTGSGEDLLGSGDPGFAPTIVGCLDHRRFSAALNVGYFVRGAVNFKAPGDRQTIGIDDSVLTSLGLLVPLGKGFDAVGDLFFSFSTDEQDKEEIPGEFLVGVRTFFDNNVIVNLGAGAGLTQGIGTPTFRLLAGLGYVDPYEPPKKPAALPDPDPDRDGILGEQDRCPMDPEDKDRFEDEDGCPDPDNDKDGIADKQDICPLEAEDKDDFEDDDGCPDPDNDNDGIADKTDRCPMEPEDKDGFEDEDGCPDPDNDNDGIADKQDRCPNEPEVFNGVEDDDGCPDESKGPVQVKRGKITTPPVFFATGRHRVLRRSLATLRLVAEVLKRNAWVKRVRVEGHTDDRGSDEHNLSLSQRRADTVNSHLVEFGVAQERLESRGFGESQPVAPNKTARGRAKNRRVDFVIIDPPMSPTSAPSAE